MAKQLQEQGISFQDKAHTWDTAEDVKEVVDALNNQKVVHYLQLDGYLLGVEAAKAIGDALKRHPEFHKALWKNLFTRSIETEIPLALNHLVEGLIAAKAKLTVLDLSDNALGPNGMGGLEAFLRSPVCYSLQELYLHNCGLGAQGGSMLSSALLDLYDNAKKAGEPLKLRIFEAGRNRLENEGAKALAKAFATLKTLEEIILMQNSICREGVAYLAESFKKNVHLKVLNMKDNTLSSQGAVKISEVFQHTPLLREINFGDCLIKTDGAYEFAEALHNTSVEVVDLGFNEIDYDGGLVLVSALKDKPNLRYLSLDGNCFGQRCCAKITEEMANSSNPTALQTLEDDYLEEDQGDDQEGSDDEYADTEDNKCNDNEDNNDSTEKADKDGVADEAADAIQNPKDNEAIAISEKQEICTPEQFCLSQKPCTLQQFNSLEAEDKLEAFKDIINKFTDDEHLLLLIFTTLKCSNLSKSSKSALDLAVSLYKATFDYALKTKQEQRVVNYVLKQLGLLRSEESFKSDYDMKSCRFALREAYVQPDFANEKIKNTIQVFMDQMDN